MNIIEEIRDRVLEGYVPYALTWGSLSEKINSSPLGFDLLEIDVSDPKNKYFFELYIAANGIAFGGKNLAMPKWVGLDCVALPTVSIGFAVPASYLKETIRKEYSIPDGFNGLVPVSMYTALPSIELPRTFVNFSMCSTISGKGLATYSMALAVFAYDADIIRSVVQYDNIALKVHSKLGKLKLEVTSVPIHTLSENTFIYSVDVRDKDSLLNNLNQVTDMDKVVKTASLLFDSTSHEQLEIINNGLMSGSKYYILSPGLLNTPDGKRIPLLIDED